MSKFFYLFIYLFIYFLHYGPLKNARNEKTHIENTKMAKFKTPGIKEYVYTAV